MHLTLGFQGSLSERDTAVFVTLEEVPNGGGASSFVTYMTKTDYDGNWEIDLATAATYLGANKLLMEHGSTIKAIANAVDEAGNITAGGITNYIMHSDHNAGLLWPNPDETANSIVNATDPAVSRLVTDPTRDLIGGDGGLLVGTEVMLTLSDSTNTGTYTVFAQSDGYYTLDFEDSSTYIEETGSTFSMSTLSHGAQVTAIINSTDALGNIYTYDSIDRDDYVQNDPTDDLQYEFIINLEGPAFNYSFKRFNDYSTATNSAAVTTNSSGTPNSNFYQLEAGDWDGDGKDEIFAQESNQIYILFFSDDGTQVTSTTSVNTRSSVDYRGMAVGDFDGDGRDDVYSNAYGSGYDYLTFNTGSGTSNVNVANNSYDHRGTFALDVNGDDHMDLIVGGGANSNEYGYIYYGDGTGNFTMTQELDLYVTAGQFISHEMQYDVDNDGDLDTLFVTGEVNNALVILFNQTNTLGAGATILSSTYDLDLTQYGDFDIGDFDGDGQVEYLVSSSSSSKLLSFDSVNKVFVTEKVLSSISITNGENIVTLDYDLDGDLDILAAKNTANSDVQFFENDGSGNFTLSTTDTGIDIDPYGQVSDMDMMADLNGDGQDEIVFYDQGERKFSVITGTDKIAYPADGNDYFDNSSDTMRVYLTSIKAGDTITVSQNGTDVIDGGGSYQVSSADAANNYVDIPLDLSTIADGNGVQFDLEITDSTGIHQPASATVALDIDTVPPVTPVIDAIQGGTSVAGYLVDDPPVITGTHGNDFQDLWITVTDGTDTATYTPTSFDNSTWTLDLATAIPVAGTAPDIDHGEVVTVNALAEDRVGATAAATQTYVADLLDMAFNSNDANLIDGFGELEFTDPAGIGVTRGFELIDWDNDGIADEYAMSTNSNVLYIFDENFNMVLSSSFTTVSGGRTAKYGNIGIAVGDFDADGFVDDIILGSQTTQFDGLMIKGNGSGGFAKTYIDNPTNQYFGTPFKGDFNGDGHEDILVYESGVIYFGGASGLSLSSGAYPFGSKETVHGMMEVDLDGDGDLDYLFGSFNEMYIIETDPSANNVTAIKYSNGVELKEKVDGFEIADLDGDGIVEIITYAADVSNGKFLHVYNYDPASGDLIYKQSIAFTGRQYTTSLITADYNGDGHLDILRNDYNSHELLVGDGNGSFTSTGFVTGIYDPDEVNANYLDHYVYGEKKMMDINHDGIDDWVTTGDRENTARLTNPVYVYYGKASGVVDGTTGTMLTNATEHINFGIENLSAGTQVEIKYNGAVVSTHTVSTAEATEGIARVELDTTTLGDEGTKSFEITATSGSGKQITLTQDFHLQYDPIPAQNNNNEYVEYDNNNNFIVWLDPSVQQDDELTLMYDGANGLEAVAGVNPYVITQNDVNQGYISVGAQTASLGWVTDPTLIYGEIEDHNTSNKSVFYGDPANGMLHVAYDDGTGTGNYTSKRFILDVDGDTDVVAAGVFDHTTDSLDLGSLLNGFVRNTGNGDLWDDLEAQGFVTRVDNGSNVEIHIDTDGTAGTVASSEHAATITGVSSADLDDNYLYYDED